LLGALLGGARIGLIAVLLVLVFDRIIPAEREPAWLSGSKLKPYLAAAGAGGLSALPPEAVDYIARLKRERGI
jgi:membrane protein required for colicin V production